MMHAVFCIYLEIKWIKKKKKKNYIRFDHCRRLQLCIKKNIRFDPGSQQNAQINTNKQLLNSVPTHM